MKRITAFTFLAASLFLGSCKKLAELTKFNVSYDTECTVDAGVTTFLPFEIRTPDVTTESESQYEGRNTARNLIQSVQLNKLQMTIISPEGRNFDFLNDIEVYISSEGNEEVLLAQKHDIPENQGNPLVLDPASVELKKYLMSDAFTLRLKVVTDKVVNEDIKLKISSTFKVDANIMGL